MRANIECFVGRWLMFEEAVVQRLLSLFLNLKLVDNFIKLKWLYIQVFSRF